MKRLNPQLNTWIKYICVAASVVVLAGGAWLAVDAQTASRLSPPIPVVSSLNALPQLVDGSTSQCYGLNVVFLVDQSSNMGGIVAATGDDPNLQRKHAVEAAIDILTDLSLDKCPGRLNIVGVVSFGDDVRQDLGMSYIQPTSTIDSSNIREELKSHLVADDMGTTNTEAAYQLGFQMLSDAEAALTPEQRLSQKQVIILITDGFPCTIPLGPGGQNYCEYVDNTEHLQEMVNDLSLAKDGQIFDPNLLNREKCLQDLFYQYGGWGREGNIDSIPPAEYNQCVETYQPGANAFEKSTYLWTLLLQSNEVPSQRVLNIMKSMTAERAGQNILLSSNADDTTNTIRKLIDLLAWVPDHQVCGNFAVNPYLKRIIISAYGSKLDPKMILTYKDTSGVEHQLTEGTATATGGFDILEHYTFGQNERYVIETPYPGIWNLGVQNGNCETMNVYYDPVSIDPQAYTSNLPAEIAQHDRPPYYDSDPKHQRFIEYQIINASDPVKVIPQADDPLLAVNVLLKVTQPDGKVVTYPVKYVPGEQLFRSSEPLQLPLPGEYTFDLKGTSLMHAGEPAVTETNPVDVFTTEYTVFEITDVKFNVYEVQPFVFEIVSPQDGSTSRSVHASLLKGMPLKVNDLPVRIRITDRDGNPLPNLDAIFQNKANAFEALLCKGSLPVCGPADASATSVTFTQDPKKLDEFTTEVLGWDYVGTHTLQVTALDTAFKKEFVPDDWTLKVDFTRKDFPWTTVAFYQIMAGILALVLLIIIIYNIAIRTNKVNGTLRFEDAGTPIAEFGLYNGTNTKKISPKELSLYPMLFLKKVSVQNAGKRRKAKKAVMDEVTRTMFADESEAQGVRVTLTTTDGRKFTLDLAPQLPTSYGEEALAQMIYEPVEYGSYS